MQEAVEFVDLLGISSPRPSDVASEVVMPGGSHSPPSVVVPPTALAWDAPAATGWAEPLQSGQGQSASAAGAVHVDVSPTQPSAAASPQEAAPSVASSGIPEVVAAATAEEATFDAAWAAYRPLTSRSQSEFIGLGRESLPEPDDAGSMIGLGQSAFGG